MQHRLVLVIALGGCARGSLGQGELGDPDASDPRIDASGGTMTDAPAAMIDGPGQLMDAPSGAIVSLLLTEIVVAPSAGEFIEIANPNTTPVDLSTYYVGDAGLYFRLPGGAPVLDPGDFIARFPAGASIPGKGVITVALDTAAMFTTTYGAAPTFALGGGTLTTVASNGVASLTNGGELVVLFRWDGTSDVVKDIDIMLAGAPTVGNALVDKSGMALDGPDADTSTTAYKTDTRTLTVQTATPASGKSTKRTMLETGHETQTGAGNGLTGDDETSETTTLTWDTTFTNPTPGTIPTALLP